MYSLKQKKRRGTEKTQRLSSQVPQLFEQAKLITYPGAQCSLDSLHTLETFENIEITNRYGNYQKMKGIKYLTIGKISKT